jgi:hypothetical protein
MQSLSSPRLKAHTTAYPGGTSALLMSTSVARLRLKRCDPSVAKVGTLVLLHGAYSLSRISRRQSKSAQPKSLPIWASSMSRSSGRCTGLPLATLASLSMVRACRFPCTSSRPTSRRASHQSRSRTSATTTRQAFGTSTASGTRPRCSTSLACTSSCGTPRGRP